MGTMPTFDSDWDYRQETMQRFIDRNAHGLDALMVPNDLDAVAVYYGDDEDNRLVAEFSSVPEFQDWAETLDRMDHESAEDAIEQLIIQKSDEGDPNEFANFTAAILSQEYSDDEVYDLDDPKHYGYMEQVAA